MRWSSLRCSTRHGVRLPRARTHARGTRQACLDARTDPGAASWSRSQVAANAASLSLTSSPSPSCSTQRRIAGTSERYRLDVETDALIAHAYGLDRESYVIVLDSFEVMAREQVKSTAL